MIRSVQVKIIMTEASRAALVEQYAGQIRQHREAWEQWQFQSKKLLADAKKKSADTYALVQEKIAREDQKRKEKLEMLQFQLQLAEQLPVGSEMDYQTVQSPVTVQIGDVWDEIMTGTEILIKDGQVHEIRQRTKGPQV
ncbi:YlqD family protein [Brevibacillus sp. GCM10020057]|uniref:YlqD family protein n=1 Tax=Brevibacillus sp. GCM10020057 TaxID=3317327 RepID=UPI003630B492